MKTHEYLISGTIHQIDHFLTPDEDNYQLDIPLDVHVLADDPDEATAIVRYKFNVRPIPGITREFSSFRIDDLGRLHTKAIVGVQTGYHYDAITKRYLPAHSIQRPKSFIPALYALTGIVRWEEEDWYICKEGYTEEWHLLAPVSHGKDRRNGRILLAKVEQK